MIGYQPGETLAHRLDPRAKLGFQGTFAIAVFLQSDPRWVSGYAVLAVGSLLVARCSPLRVLWTFRVPVLLVLLAPTLAMLSLIPPGLNPSAAIEPLRAGIRVILVLFVSAAYIRTTPIRESRAAIQWLVPGRVGVLLGVGVGLTVRLVATLSRDLDTVRDAEAARLGTDRSIRQRIRTMSAAGLRRAIRRADRLTAALQARCFAWNPTLPALTLDWYDIPVIGGCLVLLGTALL